jgi:hypothetical protein
MGDDLESAASIVEDNNARKSASGHMQVLCPVAVEPFAVSVLH